MFSSINCNTWHLSHRDACVCGGGDCPGCLITRKNDALVSAHPDLDKRGCVRFLWTLKVKYVINNNLQEEFKRRMIRIRLESFEIKFGCNEDGGAFWYPHIQANSGTFWRGDQMLFPSPRSTLVIRNIVWKFHDNQSSTKGRALKNVLDFFRSVFLEK